MKSARGPAQLARFWARAVAGTSYVAHAPAQTEALLHAHARRAARALRGPGDPAEAGRDIGARLVASHYTDPTSLQATLEVFARHGWMLGGTRAARAGLEGGLAAGYATALRETTLGQQEAIRAAAFAARDESEARFRAVFSSAPIGIGLATLDGTVLEVNQALADMFGFPSDAFPGRRVAGLARPGDPRRMWEGIDDLLAGGRDFFTYEREFTRGDGSTLWTHVRATVIRDQLGRRRFVLGLVEDVTERRSMHLDLRHQATHDPLTGLPNRVLFFERLEQLLGAGDPNRPVALCYLDLDGFKEVNDTLGHVVGDRLLVAVAGRLAGCARRPGRMVARMGGDEFVVLCADPEDAANATLAADEILDALRDPIELDGRRLTVSASVGVVTRPVAGAEPTSLVRDADITLYWAKAEGKGRWAQFDPQRSATEITQYTLSAALPAALERDQFTVDYQPIVDLRAGVVEAVEALVRWKHPDFGLLGPGRFIALAERTGVIVPLGRWVLHQACAQAAAWPAAAGAPAPVVSVNVAVRQAHDPDLVDHVLEILDATGLPAERLQLEVTESALVGAEDGSLEVLRRLAKRGIRIAIDDFGTGYSNFAYLRRLPAHTVKLDASFTRGLRDEGSSQVDEQIIAALVELAHAVGMSVTAEGVEDEGQARLLASLGCDAAQGWYFARAVPAARLKGLLRPAGPLAPLGPPPRRRSSR